MSNHRVGPYELLAPLGTGGMAETFVAVRRGPAGFEQRVCLKRILPGRTRDRRFVELFLDEARLLARMRCAGIVQVYDFGEDDGTYYMALELVDVVDLDQLAAFEQRSGGRIPVEASLYLAASLLSALAYAHELTFDGQPLSIIHRDISPSNILLSAYGEVKLTDFGIAKAQGRTHRTQTGYTKGKPAYMSPEQVRGDAVDRRTDLFSTGIVLYQLITGEHPFDAATDLQLFNNILAGKRRSVLECVPGLPPEVVTLVNALLEVEPARRPPSASDALAYIAGSVHFITGQRLLAERVNTCVLSKALSRAQTLEIFAGASLAPPGSRDGDTVPMRSESAGTEYVYAWHVPGEGGSGSHTETQFSHFVPPPQVVSVYPDLKMDTDPVSVAKNTTAPPRRASSIAVAGGARTLRVTLGAAMLLAASVAGWVVLRRLRTDVDGPLAQPQTSALPSTEAVGAVGLQPVLPSPLTVPRDAGAMALGVMAPEAIRGVSPLSPLSLPRDAGLSPSVHVSPRHRARRVVIGDGAALDAGDPSKPWIEIKSDEF